jgi:hypothetical protein
MNRFQQYQMGQAMTAAAENPAGGGAADGMGLGMGFAMASRMMQPQSAGGAGMAPPPPPPVGLTFHVTINGQTSGPFNMAQMADGIAGGQVKADTLVWSAGMSGWTPAGQVPHLAAHFAAAPPPPPSH